MSLGDFTFISNGPANTREVMIVNDGKIVEYGWGESISGRVQRIKFPETLTLKAGDQLSFTMEYDEGGETMRPIGPITVRSKADKQKKSPQPEPGA